MVRRLGLGKNNHLTYASLALNPRNILGAELDNTVVRSKQIALEKHFVHI